MSLLEKKRDQNKYCLCGVDLISYKQIFSLVCQGVNLVWNIVV